MLYKYKILILPLIVFCFAGLSLISEKPFKLEKTTVSKGFPFLPQKESKTEWTKTSWSNKVLKSHPTFTYLLTSKQIYRPSVYLITINVLEKFYSSNFLNKHSGRAPPIFT